MNKNYVVRLTGAEPAACETVVKNEKGISEKLRRAMILLEADADGPGWNDVKISEAVGCRIQIVTNVRRVFVQEGFQSALMRKKRITPPTPKLLDRAGEAKWIALRLGKPPAGYGLWTPRLHTDQLVDPRGPPDQTRTSGPSIGNSRSTQLASNCSDSHPVFSLDRALFAGRLGSEARRSATRHRCWCSNRGRSAGAADSP
jgi:hypothetical protein